MTLPINTVIMLVLGVILLVAIAGGGIPMIRGGMEDVLKWIRGGGVGSGVGVSDKLIEAIKCAYYRCKEGCRVAIEKTEEIGGFSCSDYCKAEWTDDGTLDGKICYRPPIEVFIESNIILEKFNPFHYMRVSSCNKSAKLGRSPYEAIILIDKNKIVSKNCPTGGIYNIVQPPYECEVRAATYYIWDDVSYGPFDNRIVDSVIICGNNPAALPCENYTTKSECVAGGCRWCDSCNPSNDGNQINQWGEALCKAPNIDCGYKSCNKSVCGGCEHDTDCESYEKCENCQCVTKYCCGYYDTWYCVTEAHCNIIGGTNSYKVCTNDDTCKGL